MTWSLAPKCPPQSAFCPAEHADGLLGGPWYCTAEVGHKGPHVAHSSEPEHPFCVWNEHAS